MSISAYHGIQASISLYNVASDPSEKVDLGEVASYSRELAYFVNKTIFWSQFVHKGETANHDNSTETWTARGGIGPWISIDFTPEVVEQKYNFKDAPNIVFVLIDDWGYNDFGIRSTYLNWTTPDIDNLAKEGIILENYYTSHLCSPSRSALLTGRFTIRTGVTDVNFELPLQEFLLSQEMKSAGYRTYLIGKWHLGFSTKYHTPNYRGFDSFYGFYSAADDYYTKHSSSNLKYLDLQDNEDIVTNPDEIDPSLHAAYLYQSKVEEVIKTHMKDHSNKPMFLYYSLQLIHPPWTAPNEYTNRCAMPNIANIELASDTRNYCGLNAMVNEVIANLTCTLAAYGLADNTILVISGDNGGETQDGSTTSKISGNNFPFKGQKGVYSRGGTSNTAIVHSKLIPKHLRGTRNDHLIHITDWLPTLMNRATDRKWTGSYIGADIDGVDIWDTLVSDVPSPHSLIVHYVDSAGASSALQWKDFKFYYNLNMGTVTSPPFVFANDQNPDSSRESCSNPSLVDV